MANLEVPQKHTSKQSFAFPGQNIDFKATSAPPQHVIWDEQSVTIDSFQFAHYGTMIKIDFCQLYLLQLLILQWCVTFKKKPNIVFFF